MKHATRKMISIVLALVMIIGLAIPIPTQAATFTRTNLTFEDATEASNFSGSYWSVKDGALKEGTAWGTTYLTTLLPLNEDLTISFDFYINYTGVHADSLFGFGLMNADQTQGSFGWLQRSQWGDLLTWRKNGVSGPTSNEGVGDQIVHSASDVTAGTTAFGKVNHVKINLTGSTGAMSVSVNDKSMYFTNSANLTCDIDEGYFTIRATNTSAYIDNLKIEKSGVSSDYKEDFSALTDAFSVVSGSSGVKITDNKIVGSGYSGIDYKLPVENYRLDMTFKFNAEVSGANENTLLFGVPGKNYGNGQGGYLLHFYNNGTYLFDNSITRSGWYDTNAIISKFTNPSNFQNDGKTHTLTLASYGNQFYLLLDGKCMTFGAENMSRLYEAAGELGAGYIRFVGHSWELSQFDVTCFGGSTEVADAHFHGLHSIYEKVESLDQTKYSEYSWNRVLELRTEYIGKMDAIKEGSNATAMTALVAEALEAIAAVPEKAVVPADVIGENQILIGYQVSGGSYGEGGLYNFEIGDELPEGEGIVLEPVVATMYMQTGASVRLKTDAGIRWKTIINKQDYERLTALGATFGTRVTTVGSAKFIDIPLKEGLNEGEAEHSYVGAVTNIKSANHTRVYSGCGYITLTYADGSTDTKFIKNRDNDRTYKYLVSVALSDVSDTVQNGYTYAVQKDGTTVYSPYTATQYNMLSDIFVEIKNNETAGIGTDAQIHILNVSGGEEVIAAGRPGNALSMLITYNDKNVLIDAGAIETKDIVKNYLQERDITKLDYVIATHAHEDHVEAMPYIFENFEVGTLIYKEPDWTKISSAATDQEMHDTMIAAATEKNVALVQPNEEGYKVSLGEDTYLQIFNCTNVYNNKTKNDLNYYSLQTYVVSGTATAFLASDSVGLFENEDLLNVVGKVDLYQAQHHGQGGDYSPKELLAALQPKATVAATNNTGFIDQMNERCQSYGRTYVTGSDGHLVFENQYGKFELQGDPQERWDEAKQVTVEGTELAFSNGKRVGEDGNTVSGMRYVLSGTSTGTAYVLQIPENMTQKSIISLTKGQFVYADVENLRFRIVLNDRVLYDSDISGLDGDNISLRFTVSAGDKVYFIAEGATTTVHMPVSMTINGKYFCVDHADNIDPSNGKNAVAKNFFGGLSDKGAYYTCEELLSYMSVVVTEIQ